MLSYFMGCIALVRCVLVLRCGLAVVVRYPYDGFSLHTDFYEIWYLNIFLKMYRETYVYWNVHHLDS